MANKSSRDSVNHEFSELILKARKDKNYSLRHLAYKTGMSDTHLSMIERGLTPTPYPENIKKLADALNLDYETLLRKAGLIEQKENTNDPYEILMFSDKDAFDSLPEEERERILTSLRDQADYLIDRAKRGK